MSEKAGENISTVSSFMMTPRRTIQLMNDLFFSPFNIYQFSLCFLSLSVTQLWEYRNADRLVAKSNRSDDEMHILAKVFEVESWVSLQGCAKCITLQVNKKKKTHLA